MIIDGQKGSLVSVHCSTRTIDPAAGILPGQGQSLVFWHYIDPLFFLVALSLPYNAVSPNVTSIVPATIVSSSSPEQEEDTMKTIQVDLPKVRTNQGAKNFCSLSTSSSHLPNETWLICQRSGSLRHLRHCVTYFFLAEHCLSYVDSHSIRFDVSDKVIK